LLCSTGWPLTHDPPASASRILRLQTCTIQPRYNQIFITTMFRHISKRWELGEAHKNLDN
jgi:hypothetical protein